MKKTSKRKQYQPQTTEWLKSTFVLEFFIDVTDDIRKTMTIHIQSFHVIWAWFYQVYQLEERLYLCGEEKSFKTIISQTV